MAVGRRAVEHEQRLAAIDAVVADVDVVGQPLRTNQVARQPCIVVAVEHGGQHLERIRIDVLFDVAQPRHLVGQHQIGILGGRLDPDPLDALLRRLDLRLAHRQRARLELAVGPLGQRPDLGGIDVAGHDQDRVVRHVPLAIPGADVVDAHIDQVVHPADHRMAIAGAGIDGGQQLFVDRAARGVVGTQPALFHHDLHLALEILGADHQVGHAIRFELHHPRQMLLGDLLEVHREIAIGHRVLAAAERGDLPRELARPDLGRALEHHVFEHMGHAGGAADLVDTADAIPDLMGDRGRAMVFLDDHAHAVGELELGGAAVGDRGLYRRPGGRRRVDRDALRMRQRQPRGGSEQRERGQARGAP